ncbi:MAG: sigma-70 family RNA polymerase sigma factor, partial [Planctomycetaceae bacterium]|nr:sigma-70 family RNA polymerase sigma factor [Planctomycetaceae bacterium]
VNVLQVSNCSSDITLSEEILKREIGYLYHEDFEELSLEGVQKELEQVELYEELSPNQNRGTEVPTYLRSLYEIPLLTTQGERLLFRAMNFYRHMANQARVSLNTKRSSRKTIQNVTTLLQEANQIRQQIVQSNLRLVVSIARKYSTNWQQFEELVCEGNIILVKAVDKFDYSRGYRFSTYLTHSVQRHFFRLMKKRGRIKKTEVDFPDLRDYENLGIEDNEDTLLSATNAANSLMNSMHEVLDEREQFLIRERFGFDSDGKTRTLKSLAGEMGICKERVRQILNKALSKLKEFTSENPNQISPI